MRQAEPYSIQISLGGYASVALGWIESIETDFMSLLAVLDFRHPAIRIPTWYGSAWTRSLGEKHKKARAD